MMPNEDFKYIIGSDLLDSITKWKDYYSFLKYFPFIVFKRNENDIK